MAQGRDASRAKGQGVRPSNMKGLSVGAKASVGSDRRGHTKGPVARTIATRLPKKWGC